MPAATRLLYWDDPQAKFVSVPDAVGLGVAKNQFNRTFFPSIKTSRLRLELDPEGEFSTGMLEWRVYDSGQSPLFPPRVNAGPDRVVVEGGQTYLDATVVTTGQTGSDAAGSNSRTAVSLSGRFAIGCHVIVSVLMLGFLQATLEAIWTIKPL